MKNILKYELSIGGYLVAFVLWASMFSRVVYAQSDFELLKAGTTIDSDFIRAAQTIQIDGEIKGDAYLAGGIVTVNGKVDGDLIVMGGKVNINGEVGNSVRVFGGDVTLNGPVGRNALMVCANCSITKQSTVTGSLLVAGGNGEVAAGKIGKGFRFFGTRLYLNSGIANEAYVVADQQFLLGPNASVSSDLKYTGNSAVVIQPGATVGGTIAYQKTNQDQNFPRFFGAKIILESYARAKPVVDLIGFGISALVGFVFLGLFPKVFEKVSNAIENRTLASFGVGLIVLVSVPLAAILFAITVVGIPVSLILVIMGSAVLLAAKYLMAFVLGRRILNVKFGERRGWAMVMGLFIFYLLGFVPFFGNFFKLILMVFGLGAIVFAYRQPVIIKDKTIKEISSFKLKKKKA